MDISPKYKVKIGKDLDDREMWFPVRYFSPVMSYGPMANNDYLPGF